MKYTQVPVSTFLRKRLADLEATKKYVAEHPDESIIVVDAETDIICDTCNAEVDEDPLWVSSWGVACAACRKEQK